MTHARFAPDDDAPGSVGSMLESQADSHYGRDEPEESADARGDADRFVVGEELGHGSMGRVLLAHDQRLLREVAWKRGDWRLLREARILAQLEHPGIVPVYDMGFDNDGEPYFAMRAVRGRSLADVLRRPDPVEPHDTLRALLQAAEAVAYAHYRGVVHRDLKPANIMLGRFGESQVVDWGLARVLDEAQEPLPVAARQALAGQAIGVIGTPGFMSPEQARGSAADRRSDVFGLGRILACIMSGAPFAASPELAAIVRKSSERDPDRRYADAGEFARDLKRYLDGRPVLAHRYRQRELLARFVRAQRVPLIIILVGVVTLLGLGWMHLTKVAAEREAALLAASETRIALARSDANLSRSLIGEARHLLAAGASLEAEILAAHAVAIKDDPAARGVLAAVGGRPQLELISRQRSPCVEADIDPTRARVLCIEPESLALWDLSADGLTRRWRREEPVRTARLVASGVVATSSERDEVVLIDLEGAEVMRAESVVFVNRKSDVIGARVVFENIGPVLAVDFDARRIERIAVCDGPSHGAFALGAGPRWFDAVVCHDGSLHLADGVRATPLVTPEREAARMAVIRDDEIVVGTTKGEVAVLDREGRMRASRRVVSGMVRLLVPSPDGRRLAVAGDGDPILLVTLPDLAPIGSLPRRAKTIVWDAARRGELMTAGRWLERWRLSDAEVTRPLDGAYSVPLADGVVALDIDPIPDPAASDPAAPDRVAVSFGSFVGVLTNDRASTRETGLRTTKGAALSGPHLVAAGINGVHVYDSETLATAGASLEWGTRRLGVLDDGSRLLVRYRDVVRVEQDRLTTVLATPCVDLAVASDRRSAVVLVEHDRTFWRIRTAAPEPELIGVDPRSEAVALGVDRVYSARRGGVAVWDEGGALVMEHDAGAAQLTEVAVSADTTWVAAGALDGTTYLWRVGEVEPRALFFDHSERIAALAFAPNGHWFLSGSWDRTVKVRDLAAVELPVSTFAASLERRYHVDLSEALGAGR